MAGLIAFLAIAMMTNLQGDNLIGELTGAASKTWKLFSERTTLGGSSQCEYRFRTDNTVTIEGCLRPNGRFNWDHRSNGIDTFISFDGQEYRLLIFEMDETIEEAILRVENAQVDWTTDIVLRHGE